MRKDFKIGTVIAVLAFALLTQGAQAQGKGGKGKRQQPSAQSAEDTAKKKALDADYNNALKTIPTATEKADPWKTMR
jgi:hypothetical protein